VIVDAVHSGDLAGDRAVWRGGVTDAVVDDDRPDFLALRSGTPIIRYLELPTARPPVKVDDRVRILAMVSSPRRYADLDVDHERAVIDEALSVLIGKGLADIVWLEDATLAALNNALEAGPFSHLSLPRPRDVRPLLR
jgi:hypothetical protein